MSEKMEKEQSFMEKALQPMISSNYFESGLESANDPPIYYDPNRRSSLGAESLLEHDICEDNGNLEDGCEPALLEAQIGLEYADEIFLLNRYKERTNHPQRYIEEQPQVTEHMRCTLINWLIKVNSELRFGPETIFIAVSLTDRFLESTPIAHDCLQLLAVCALYIAAKLEETVVPGISALVSLCGSTYKHHHFRRMETLLLSTLRFELYSPTTWFFVTYIVLKSSHLSPLDRRILNMARYVIETCLGSYNISQFYPSEQGASAICFSSLIIYYPSYVYSSSSSQADPCSIESKATELESAKKEYEEEDNLFDVLANLNASSSSLAWTFQNTFSLDELRKISVCYSMIKEYMKPFLHSYSSNLEPSGFTLGTLSTLKSHNDVKELEIHGNTNKKKSLASPTCQKEITDPEKVIREYPNFFISKKKPVFKDREKLDSQNISNKIQLSTDQLMDEASDMENTDYGSGKGCNVT